MSNRLQSSYFLSHTVKRDLTALWPTFAVLTRYSGSNHAVYSLEVIGKEGHSRVLRSQRMVALRTCSTIM